MERSSFDVPYSDEWWFKRLFDAFFETKTRHDGRKHNRIDWFENLWNWYEGNAPLPQHAAGWQAQVTRDVLRMGRANFAMLAVESKLDRLSLLSFRPVDDDTADDDETKDGSDDVARRLMAKYGTVFDDALLYASVMTEGYIWVGQKGADGLPEVTAEDPRSCVAITDPVDSNKTLAAMKLYRSNLDGYDFAHVVLPASKNDPDQPIRIRVAKRKSAGAGVSPRFSPGAWDWDDSLSGPLPIQDRGILVHRIVAPNGLGDFEPFLDLLERINNMIVDRLWISKFQAFRQRALVDESKGDEYDNDDDAETDDEDETDWNEILAADPGALWKLPRAMKIWESTPANIQDALNAVKDDIKEFAAVSRTPMYVFTPDATEGSAEGAALARESQVFKVEKWQKRSRRVFTAAASDMLAIAGHTVDELELQWSPADRVTMGQRGLAAQSAKNSDVPTEGIWETFWQQDPETIKRWRKMRRRDQLFAQPQGQAAPQFIAPQRPPEEVQPQDVTAFDDKNPRRRDDPLNGDRATA